MNQVEKIKQDLNPDTMIIAVHNYIKKNGYHGQTVPAKGPHPGVVRLKYETAKRNARQKVRA